MITVNHRATAAAVREVQNRLAAVAATIRPGGRAEVAIVTQHGRAAADSLARRGRDPLEVPTREIGPIHDQMRLGVLRVLMLAERTGRPQVAELRAVLLAGAEATADVIRQRIIDGRLGRNAPGYAAAKARYQRRHGPTRYGVPAPYGIRTGRMIQAIVARWVQGRG